LKEEMKMENARTIVWVMAVLLSVASSPVLALVEFKDGGIHNIDYAINDDVWVDWQTPLMYTTVNMLAGGTITYPYNLQALEDSRINILGGAIGRDLAAYGGSQVDIFGGSIGGGFVRHRQQPGRYVRRVDRKLPVRLGQQPGQFLRRVDRI